MLKIGNCYVIDFSKIDNKNIFNLNIKSRDSKRYINLQLINNEEVVDLTDYTIVVKAIKKDANIIFNHVEKANPKTGRCKMEITPQMLAIGDTLPCEIILYGSDGTIASSNNFDINIIKSSSDEEIISSNEFNALVEALKTVSDIDSLKLGLKYVNNEINSIDNEINSVKRSDMNLKDSLDYTYINTRKADISNLNTTVQPGVYSVGADHIITGTPLNEPMYGTLLVLSRRGNEVQQIFITIDGVMYLRYYDHLGEWRNWTKIANFKDNRLNAENITANNFYAKNGKLILAYDEHNDKFFLGTNVDLNGFNLRTTRITCNKFYSEVKNHLYLAYDEINNQILVGSNINLNGFQLSGGTVVGLNLYNATATFNLDDNKAKIALLNEDFSTQDKKSNEVTVNINEIIKHLYLKNLELENEIKQLKNIYNNGDINVK